MRVLVILFQVLGAVFKGDESGGGENSGLTHATTESFANHTRFVDELAAADEHGSYGSAECFRETKHDGVAALRETVDGSAECGGGVEDAGAIHVNGNSSSVGVIADVVDLLGGKAGASGHVVRVLEGDEPGLCAIVDLGRDGG